MMGNDNDQDKDQDNEGLPRISLRLEVTPQSILLFPFDLC
jgi:hypothetical protein